MRDIAAQETFLRYAIGCRKPNASGELRPEAEARDERTL
jgi:hypothetical protein